MKKLPDYEGKATLNSKKSSSNKNEDKVVYRPNNKYFDQTSTPTTIIKASVKTDDSNIVNYQYKIKTDKLQKSNYELTNQEKDLVKNVIVTNLKQNKITPGTQKMMDNERFHALEAIESGIYVNWTAKKNNELVDCFRLGSKSLCICNHYFAEHDKIVTSKKFSSKCKTCSCKSFAFIPTLPEEIGEYWIPHQKNFSYNTFLVKCKCKHPWNQHAADKFLKCKSCNCYGFNSNFCCVVCNQFWQDHSNTYETEHERYQLKKPVGNDYIPFAEALDIYDAMYNKELPSGDK